jgi:hypothetical protein
MGILDALRGIKRPESGATPVARDELERRLLALNAEQIPFRIAPDDESDLHAEWKIVDAGWYEIFGKAGLSKAHRIYLRLDESEHEVRVLEEAWEVSWQAGVPKLSLSMEKFQGRTLGSKSFGTAYAFTGINPLNFGEAYRYRFDVSEMKDPLITTITNSGWTWVPVQTKRKVRRD